jgi:hypothetical protein
MFRAGQYFVNVAYSGGERNFCIKHGKGQYKRHTHIPMECGFNTAKMCAVRASRGTIPPHYPEFMVVSINRLWFGEDFMDRNDIVNENLHTNDPCIRLKRISVNKKRKTAKKYMDTHVHIAFHKK